MDDEASNIPVAMREKLWTERDTEQKLEALRQELLHLSYLCHDQRKQLERLMLHQHGAHGEILAPIHGPFVLVEHPREYSGNTPMGLRDKE